MAQGKLIDLLPWSERYVVRDTDPVLTPALVIYPEILDANIDVTLKLLGGDPQRWRPHVKTSKLAFTMRRLVDRGVLNFKCATTLELLTACQNGAQDVLVAYPLMGANAERVKAIATEFPGVRISALVEHESQIARWQRSSIGLFLDINPGMDRTGVEQSHADELIRLATLVRRAGLAFRGLHYYDGHLGSLPLDERTRAAHTGYDRLMEITAAMKQAGVPVEELITAGTPAFPCTASYRGFQQPGLQHRASPGTVVYNDATDLGQLPPEYGYHPAALVISRVVSHPRPGIVTCDAGHKTVSADAGIPTCVVVGRAGLQPLSPSEEHLPIKVESGDVPPIGEILYLLPRHVCPTVNNFDDALICRQGCIEQVEPVTARGREAPILAAPGQIAATR